MTVPASGTSRTAHQRLVHQTVLDLEAQLTRERRSADADEGKIARSSAAHALVLLQDMEAKARRP